MPRSVLARTEVEWTEIEPILAALERGEPDVAARTPESVLERLAVVGTPEEVAGKLTCFASRGLDAPILYLHGSDPARALELAGALLPVLRAR